MSINFKVISTWLISISMMGFLIIQFSTENKLPQLETYNIELNSKQKSSLDFMIYANASTDIADILKVNIELKDQITDEKLKKYNDKIIERRRAAAMFALDASLSVGEIDEDEFKEIFRLVKPSEKQLHDIYIRYMEIAATGTQKLQKNINKNKKKILDFQSIKNSVWYSMFFLQFIGLILAIRSNGVKE